MAISDLPPWMTGFKSPADILSLGAAAGARDYANQLANRQGQLEAQRTQAQIAQQQAALQQQAQEEANRFAMEQAKFGMQQQAADVTAKKEAMRFAGVQGLQAAISGGKKFEEAFPDFAALILGDTGAGMSSLFNSIVGTDSREAMFTDKLQSAANLQADRLASSEQKQREMIEAMDQRQTNKDVAALERIKAKALLESGLKQGDPEYIAFQRELTAVGKSDLELPEMLDEMNRLAQVEKARRVIKSDTSSAFRWNPETRKLETIK